MSNPDALLNAQEHEENPTLHVALQTSAKEQNKQTTQKLLYGILIVIGIAISWTGSTQFAQTVETKSFDVPFAIMWFSTSFKILCCIPVIIKSHYVNVVNPKQLKEDKLVSPFSKFSALRYIYFYSLWAAANHCYVRALSEISATLVTALFSSAPAFVYIFSILLLDDNKHSCFKVIAVLFCIGGILLISLSNPSHDGKFAFLGCILSVFAAICAALYKVSFKKVYGDMDVFHVCQFLSLLGTFNFLFMWIVIVILDVFKLETFPNGSMVDWPWLYLVGAACLGLIFDFFINFGIALTYPLFISLGTVIGIPINLCVDIIIHGTAFNATQLIGAFVICVGFVIMVISDKWDC